jgi:hypothetical protein
MKLISRALTAIRSASPATLAGDLLGAAAIPALIWLALVAGHVLSPT